ncbi:TolC family protein [bacterium]|nr:TolC family protein [bacterium]
MRTITSILFVFGLVQSFAQSVELKVLTHDDFLSRVAEHHPLARQADIQIQKGDAYVMKARGSFDPKLHTDLSQKYFDDKTYYSLLDAGLKVPTWFGLEFQGGYEQNRGLLLNPENSNPNSGLVYAGLSLPIGRGLFIDERRASLRQAQIFQESTAVQRQAMVNQLLYESASVYWEWFAAYNSVQVYEEGLQLATQRFNAVKRGAALGDRPSIDTLESGIQVQNRKLMVQQAKLDFANTSAKLATYLWDEGVIPLELSENTVAPTMDQTSSLSLNRTYVNQLDSLTKNHPELQQYRFKIDQLEIEQRWKREQLKPNLNLKYNALSEPVNGDVLSAYSPNNYNWGLEFAMPLLLRKERGDVRLNAIKIQEAEFDISNKEQMLVFKARAALNDWQTTDEQVTLYRKTVRDYNGLLSGERTLFNNGESSLFMVNSREMGYIKAKIKLVELLAKNRKARVSADYAFGILGVE